MVQQSEYNKFLLLHKPQLLSAGIPEHFWETLYVKVKNQVFDSNETFVLLQIDYQDEERMPEDPVFILKVQSEDGIKSGDKKHIYLVDHAWTFRANTARQQLVEIPSLLDRMCGIMGIEKGQGAEEQVFRSMWKYCQTYSIGNAVNIEDRLPVWYIMDELGCGIQHSDTPNFRAVPFVYAPDQITYTLIFPIKDLEFSTTVTRDFVEGLDQNQRAGLLTPWVKTDFTDLDCTQLEPNEQYFLSGHIAESLPDILETKPELPPKLKVYSEYNLINQYLTDPRFELVDTEETADILWLTGHFKNYSEFSKNPNRFISQFPFENVLTIKDLLAIVCRRAETQVLDPVGLETKPKWLPTTYNLNTELYKFISYYQKREKLGLDNHWICKPWNLARSLDTHITNNLDYIVRLPSTGPKIAQKYIHNPVLFKRNLGSVKFDIRYVILLKSIKPLECYIYNNFFLRFSNKPFELNHFDDYETHFTVMNYQNEENLHHLPCAEFLLQWNAQFPNFPWPNIETNIINMLRDVFVAAAQQEPPKGIAHSPQSRAVYAADIMLSWEQEQMQPKLLEINWIPDCKRACVYYPNFYNDIFACLFLNDNTSNSFTSV